MIKIEPVMDADIVPGIQAAGIKLGISFDYFKKAQNIFINLRRKNVMCYQLIIYGFFSIEMR